MIFVVNSGSSSLKFKLFDPKLKGLASGIVERIGLDKPFLKSEVGGKETKQEFSAVPDHSDALDKVLKALAKGGVDMKGVKAVGHRVVHGGEEFVAPTLLTASVLERLKTYNALAPLHNPPNLMGIGAVSKVMPGIPNVAVFDTAFYRTIAPEAFMYSLPYELYEKRRIRKYGFHGISHEYVVAQAAKTLKKPLAKLRLVSCHLGSGASITAVKGGKAFDTSMGFTPLEGLTMSTRCGDIDAAIPLFLMRGGMSIDEVDDLMNRKSGLLGVSGHKDMRDVIEAMKKGDKRAKLAFDMFIYDVARYAAQFAVMMGGCDAVIFTAGIGERSKEVRNAVMKWLKPLKAKMLIVPTDEEGMIARETAKLLGLSSRAPHRAGR